MNEVNYYAQKVKAYGEKIANIVYEVNNDGEYTFNNGNYPIISPNKKINGFFIDKYGTYLVIRYMENKRIYDHSYDLVYDEHDFQKDADTYQEFCLELMDIHMLEILKKIYVKLTNIRTTKQITESQLRAIVAESVKKVLNEISLSNYDNPSIRKGFMDGDEFSTDGVEYNPSVNPEYDDREERWNELLSMRNRGMLSNEELDAIRDRFGY